MELMIPLSQKGEPLFRQVYLGLRQAILSGVLRAGDRIPIFAQSHFSGNKAARLRGIIVPA